MIRPFVFVLTSLLRFEETVAAVILCHNRTSTVDFHPLKFLPQIHAKMSGYFLQTVAPNFGLCQSWKEVMLSYVNDSFVLEPERSYFLVTIMSPPFSVSTLKALLKLHSGDAVKRQNVVILEWPQKFVSEESAYEELKKALTQTPAGRLLSTSLLDQVYIWTAILDTDWGIIWEVYKIRNDTFLRRFDVGGNTDPSTTIFLNAAAFASRRQDFNSSILQVVAQRDDSYKIITDVRVNGTLVEFVGGVGTHLLWDLQILFNFRIHSIEGNGWITQIPNSTELTGMAEQIVTGVADLSISPSAIHAYRAAKLRFLPALTYSKGMAVYRQPPVGSRKNMLLLPFETPVWITIMAVWLAILVSVLIVTRAHDGRSGKSVKNSIILIIGLISQQGYRQQLHTSSFRTLIATGIVTSLLTYQYYTASFVATVSAPAQFISTAENLEEYKFEMFLNPDFPEFALDFIMNPADLDELVVTSRALYRGNADALMKVASPNSRRAFLINSDGGLSTDLEKSMRADDICRISTIEAKHAQRVKEAMFVAKGSSFAESLSYGTNILVERGLNFRYWNMYRRGTYFHCLCTTQLGDFVVIDSKHISIASGILLGGALVAATIFCKEYLEKTQDGR